MARICDDVTQGSIITMSKF